jgi:putative intracellular protease/amidase
LMSSCKPIQNLKETPKGYQGSLGLSRDTIRYDRSRKNVFIIADSKATEIFDMLAPYSLFSSTGMANVYIIAKNQSPIMVKKELFILPTITFREADSIGIVADAIVIPALSARDEQQDSSIVNWIRSRFTPSTRILAVCDGAATAAATGLYDGKPLTCHASDFKNLKAHFSKPDWVQGVSVTRSGNLFSTAGVSNAVEGSLTLIEELFSTETMHTVAERIHYPHASVKYAHQSISINSNSKLQIVRKLMFRKNKRLGILIGDGVDELVLASVLDTYGRTFPSLIKAFAPGDSIVQTKFGLTVLCTGTEIHQRYDELHLLMPDTSFNKIVPLSRAKELVRYDALQTQYPVELCLKKISDQYGYKFENVVKQLLDYN